MWSQLLAPLLRTGRPRRGHSDGDRSL